MPKDCHGKSADELSQLITNRASDEKARVDQCLDSTIIQEYVLKTTAHIEKSLDENTDEWKTLVPGRQVIAILASKAKLDVGRPKLLYLREAETHTPYPFDEIVDVFARFDGR